MRLLDVVEKMFLCSKHDSKTNPAGVDDVLRILSGVEVGMEESEVFLYSRPILTEKGEVALPAGQFPQV